jgi:hypothetical protein
LQPEEDRKGTCLECETENSYYFYAISFIFIGILIDLSTRHEKVKISRSFQVASWRKMMIEFVPAEKN